MKEGRKTLLLGNNYGGLVKNHLDYLFIALICLATTLLLLAFAHTNSLVSTDESGYLINGQEIVLGEYYSRAFPDGRPLIPSVIALFFSLGFDIVTVRFLIPVIFMNTALLATFALGKTLYGRKEAYLATLFLFTFPFFWDIGNTVLVDIPLTVFTTLFLLFFYLGVEKEKKYLYFAAMFISLAILTKLTAILFFLPAFLYLIISKKLNICLKKEFVFSAAVIPLLFVGVYALFHFFMSTTFSSSNLEGAAAIPFYPFEVLRLGLAPVLVLAVFGVSKEKRNLYLLLPVLTFFLFWSIQGRFFDLRQFISLSPLVGILISLGFFRLSNRYNKKAVSLVFALLLAISFVHAVYLNDYHQDTGWGITMLSKAVNRLEEKGKIGIDNQTVAYYLSVATDKDIIEAFGFSGKYPSAVPTYEIITEEWLRKNDVTYLVLSIYSEQYRARLDGAIHPKFLMLFDIPFLEVGRYSQLPTSVSQFKSDLYNELERDYQRVETISKGEQEVFIIFKVR
ncbi:MAG: glycosyltransferase family 39 protein [Dehalococcoidales bacterium]|nr:glycosyltransferase family 39 protein [Dehalococcoidales bacterium]